MRLQKLEVTNFRGFAQRAIQFHPNFNLLIGINGTGKTSVLEAAAVALGAWLQGFPGTDSRSIRVRDIRRVEREVGGRIQILPQYPATVLAEADLGELTPRGNSNFAIMQWNRCVQSSGGRTTLAGSRELRNAAKLTAKSIRSGHTVTLPVIRYFGAGRLWESVRTPKGKSQTATKHLSEELADSDEKLTDLFANPFYGYRMSVDKRASPGDLLRWIREERRTEIDLEKPSVALRLVYQAIEKMLPEIESTRFELRRNMLILKHHGGAAVAFQDMSDGYRNVIAMAADLAIKMSMLNPHLEQQALEQTPGIVLIDELDLHLHPTWQRRIAEDLRRTFPLVQFICTSHSPFIVQSLRSGEELIVLDGQPTGETANMTLEEVSEGLMGVSHAEVSLRYGKMKETARSLFEQMEQEDLSSPERFDRFHQQLAAAISPFADNPAYQAFVEMKLAAKASREQE